MILILIALIAHKNNLGDFEKALSVIDLCRLVWTLEEEISVFTIANVDVLSRQN